QIAEAAYRMRILFRDIDPKDPSVAAAVKSTFTNHIELTPEFASLVWRKINDLDKEALEPGTQNYYQDIFSSWLNN
ncbi:MAG: hypothetical protein MJK18_14735, partial [Bdellovibrionales bacterium]|nr:hypothetical protein [Bdellovibrionales bacterium]